MQTKLSDLTDGQLFGYEVEEGPRLSYCRLAFSVLRRTGQSSRFHAVAITVRCARFSQDGDYFISQSSTTLESRFLSSDRSLQAVSNNTRNLLAEV